MDRFFARQKRVGGEEITLEGQQSHQICNVLRKKAGEHIIVLDNLGWEYEVELKTIKKEKVTGQIKEKRKATGEPAVEITLYQSLLGREKFEWVLQKCTEVGVRRFVPMVTERSIVREEAMKANKRERRQRIIQEAAEQSARGRIPELERAVNFEEAMAKLEDFDCKLMAHTQGQGESLRECLKSSGKKIKRVALFIGPEGGFTENEVQTARSNNVSLVNLGQRVLRTETAAVVVSSLILHESGEMGGL